MKTKLTFLVATGIMLLSLWIPGNGMAQGNPNSNERKIEKPSQPTDAISPSTLSISCPVNITQGTDQGICGAVVNYPPPVYTGGTLIVTGPESGTVFYPGLNYIIFTVVDPVGSSLSCTLEITIIDTENPTVDTPADITTYTDPGENYATLTPPPPNASDNCGTPVIVNNAPPTFPVGPTEITWTVTDDAGNLTIRNNTVTVLDNQPPSLSCPPDLTFPVDAQNCSASGIALGDAVATDNDLISSLSNNAPLVFPVGTTIVQWTAYDPSGNSAICNQLITIVDNLTAVLICPPDITVSADPGFCEATNVNLGYVGTGSPCATLTSDAPANFPAGTTMVTWTLTDGAGATQTCTQNVTVLDTEAPLISCPANVSYCIKVGGTDCYSAVIYDIDPITIDNCGLASITYKLSGATTGTGTLTASGRLFKQGTTTVTYTITDLSGNISSCSFTVQVVEIKVANICSELKTLCNASSVSLAANTPGTGATGEWTQLSGPAIAVIENPAYYTTTATELVPGTYTFRYVIYEEFCSTDDTMTVVNNFPSSIANAGPDQILCGTDLTILEGNQPEYGIGTWTKSGGPCNYNFVDNHLYNTEVNELIPGTYNFKWTIKNGNCASSYDIVKVRIYAPATVNAGCNTNLSLSANTYKLNNSSACNYQSISWSTAGNGTFSDASILHPTYYFTAEEKTAGFVWLYIQANSFASCSPAVDSVKINFVSCNSSLITEEFDLAFEIAPNPVADLAKISFELPEDGVLTIAIYDMLGREVQLLIDNRTLSAGLFSEQFDLRNLNTGLFILRLTLNGTSNYSLSRQLILTR